ncbi:hypothetical protein MSG28_011703 [Choristoneura fumiferana]|uniref:Uncharacterized protein n=1 Tax=Choristoneura fumiferana TaxID=7141 RepID=A0ACC0KM29_CHOFU|nr:hypothetical protein MSG28_011703 [Choristoneura fumiferana]
MKCVVFFALVAMSLVVAIPVEDVAGASSRGCRYIMGRCAEVCPVGTHAYTTGCNFLMPEATCKKPTPVLDTRGMICDYSSCYCDEPTVRDEKTGQCVALDKCS